MATKSTKTLNSRQSDPSSSDTSEDDEETKKIKAAICDDSIFQVQMKQNTPIVSTNCITSAASTTNGMF